MVLVGIFLVWLMPAVGAQAPAAKPAAPQGQPAPAPGATAPAPASPPPAAAPAQEAYTYKPDGRRDPFLNLLGTGTENKLTSHKGEGPAVALGGNQSRTGR
jgi:hypothetical protein